MMNTKRQYPTFVWSSDIRMTMQVYYYNVCVLTLQRVSKSTPSIQTKKKAVNKSNIGRRGKLHPFKYDDVR